MTELELELTEAGYQKMSRDFLESLEKGDRIRIAITEGHFNEGWHHACQDLFIVRKAFDGERFGLKAKNGVKPMYGPSTSYWDIGMHETKILFAKKMKKYKKPRIKTKPHFEEDELYIADLIF